MPRIAVPLAAAAWRTGVFVLLAGVLSMHGFAPPEGGAGHLRPVVMVDDLVPADHQSSSAAAASGHEANPGVPSHQEHRGMALCLAVLAGVVLLALLGARLVRPGPGAVAAAVATGIVSVPSRAPPGPTLESLCVLRV